MKVDVWVIWLASLGLTRGGTALPDLDGAAMGVALRQRHPGSTVIRVLPGSMPVEGDPFSPCIDEERLQESDDDPAR